MSSHSLSTSSKVTSNRLEPLPTDFNPLDAREGVAEAHAGVSASFHAGASRAASNRPAMACELGLSAAAR